MSWTDNLQAEADVSLRRSGGQLIIDFSGLVEPEILRDLDELNNKPGFKVNNYHEQETTFIVFKPDTYSIKNVANAIRKMLESHGLVVTENLI